MNELNTPAAFVRWLAQNRNEVVGVTNNSTNCPIRNFVYSLKGPGFDIAVSQSYMAIFHQGTEIYGQDNPDWVQTFIRSVDEVGKSLGDVRNIWINLTGAECLLLIGSMYPEPERLDQDILDLVKLI